MSSGPPPFLPRIAAASSSTTHTRSPAKFARKPAFSVKSEEVVLKQELEPSHGEGRAVVSDADAQLLLGLHLGSATSAPPSVTSPASRVSIASLVNAVDVPVPMRPPNLSTPPHSAPAGTTSFSEPLVHQLRARSASPRASALPPLALTPPGAYAPEIVSAAESRATRSMSISVEPEPAPIEEIARPIRPAPTNATPPSSKTSTKAPSSSSPVKASSSSPAKSSASKPSPSKILPLFKLPKPRGRVSKGPKKREGKGWIIESCTTSGAPSDNEVDPQPDAAPSASVLKSSPEPSIIAARLEDLSRDVFGGDSDMSDLSSDSDEGEEYDPGLAGLPALPVSSESEYEPGLRAEMAGEKRSRRRGVNYQDFQASARSSVRLITRSARSPPKSEDDAEGSDAGTGEAGETSRSAASGARGGKAQHRSMRRASKPHQAEDESVGEDGGETSRTKHGAASGSRARPASKAHEAESEAEDGEPAPGSPVKRGTVTGSRARGRGSRRGPSRSLTATSTSVSATPTSTRGARRGKSRNVVQAPVSAVSSISLGAWADDATFATSALGPRLSKTAARARQSTSGSGKSGTIATSSSLTEFSSPSLGDTHLLDSPLLVGARQQESPSLGGTRSDAGMTHVSESVEGTHVSETTGAGGVDETETVEARAEKSPRRRIIARGVGHERTGGALESPKRTAVGSPERAGGIAQSPRIKAMVEVMLPSRGKSNHHSSPTRAIATTARLVPASMGGSSSRSSQQVYVLLPTSGSHHAFGRRAREPSTTSDEPSVDEVVVKGRRKSHGEADRGSPSKRSRVDGGASLSLDKGKGKAAAVESGIDYDMTSGSGRRSRRQAKPTMRALESAQQELGWDGGDLAGESIWVTIQGNRSARSSAPSEDTGSRSMSLSRSASVGASAGRSTRGSGKRRREDNENASSSSKRNKTSQATESTVSKAPMVHLQDGDFILRVQDKKCFHYAWDQATVPRCLACRKKKAGDTCRFSGIRYFKLTPVSFDAIGVTFDSRQNKEQSDYHLPFKWNITPDIAHVDRIRSVISRALYPVLGEELKHALKENAIWRPVEIEVRATCDVCATSMFASCHMCTQCGRELCGECYRQVEQMCPAGTPTYYRSTERKDQHLHKYRACAGGSIFHLPNNFRPITRFTRRELEETLKDMKTIIDDNATAQLPSRAGSSHITKWASRIPAWNPTSPQASTEPPALSETGSSHDVSSLRGTPDAQLPSMPIIASPSMSPTHEDGFAPEVSVEAGKRPVASQYGHVDLAGVPTHPINYFPKDITEDAFKPIWARGEAVVVQGLLDNFKIKWTPEYFIQEYGEQDCFVVDCNTDKQTWSTVEAFFKQFGQADRGDAILKLKDWPARADFRDDFPDLFIDFMNALPIPNYTRRDGILNVASHFATNAIAPDLGPKMYNAFASNEGSGGQGSTRLHMDMADAVNIMMFANDSKDGLPGVAAWDIFRASDSDKIRAYLRRHFENKSSEYRDPIHSQLFYLDSDHRRRLYEEEKVYSWRIYQRPGEAVFIPAGCAHQVCNLADCIKVAIDFVSLENIDRCEKLTAEFRNENDTYTWKEDVLQLRTMMMYAWRSAVQLRRAWEEEYPSAKG